MAERFTLNEHGEAVPYVPTAPGARPVYQRPESRFHTGDPVILQGVVVETVHLQGETHNVRVAVGGQHIWIEQSLLQTAAEYDAAREAKSRAERAVARRDTKAIEEPPVTRAVRKAPETK